MEFKKYQHLERLGKPEVEGILSGLVYIQPKLDGANASIWLDDDGEVQCGSRNKQLKWQENLSGFYKYAKQHEGIKAFLTKYPDHRLYGEWLIQHQIVYNEDAYKQFYLFDIQKGDGSYIPFTADVLESLVQEFKINVVPTVALNIDTIPDAVEYLTQIAKQATFLLPAKAIPEGIVIKNYKFINARGNIVWAKLLNKKFVEERDIKLKSPKTGKHTLDLTLFNKIFTNDRIEKELAKENTQGISRKDSCLHLFEEFLRDDLPELVLSKKINDLNFKEVKSYLFQRLSGVY